VMAMQDDEYISKPFTPKMLLQNVANALAKCVLSCGHCRSLC
jgi:DNA-binding response OmpR family regulator